MCLGADARAHPYLLCCIYIDFLSHSSPSRRVTCACIKQFGLLMAGVCRFSRPLQTRMRDGTTKLLPLKIYRRQTTTPYRHASSSLTSLLSSDPPSGSPFLAQAWPCPFWPVASHPISRTGCSSFSEPAPRSTSPAFCGLSRPIGGFLVWAEESTFGCSWAWKRVPPNCKLGFDWHEP